MTRARSISTTRKCAAKAPDKGAPPPTAHEIINAWFHSRSWTPFSYQQQTWNAYLEGRSGLVHAPTGTGKSLAVWLGPVMEWLAENPHHQTNAPEPSAPLTPRQRTAQRKSAEPIRILWITPMRALAGDTMRSLAAPIDDLHIPWTIESRTGDTASSLKLKQRDQLPTCLITTPESLSLLLSYPGSRERFASLRAIIVDEWHELLSSKRGTQTELALARLRAWLPHLRTWGLSATLGNLTQAAEILTGTPSASSPPTLISGDLEKQIEIETILPDSIERFPWAGHIGLKLLEQVIERIERCRTTLLFTNTRSQSEIWFRALLDARPEWIGQLAIHHGSLDRDIRTGVENMLRAGTVRCVVCTSSLDLGVDFSPVEQVMQLGSPKGVARLLQRAGRSGHQPGAVSRVICIPSNALEIIEFAAARDAANRREIERREPIRKPLDVLVQHIVTIGLAEHLHIPSLFHEIRSAWSYQDLTPDEWNWCIDFVTHGGSTLAAYPQFCRMIREGDSLRVASRAIERTHRLGIGTITSDTAMKVQFVGGKTLGTIEESFIARLKPGDRFIFGGRALQLVRIHQMTAQVRRVTRMSGAVPRWEGGRTPLSTQLAHAVRRKLSEHSASSGQRDPEMHTSAPLLDLQARWSRIPQPDELLIERTETRDGHHVFVYPFEGRLVHEGLGALLAHRLARSRPITIRVAANDWGLELLSSEPWNETESDWRTLFSLDALLDDLLSCLNSTELTRRQFRDIARVSGLIIPGYPGAAGRSTRQVQASSELFFDVFREFDPTNRLLEQAGREVLEQQLEVGRLTSALERIAAQRLTLLSPARLSPFAFPLWAESLRTQQISSEQWNERIRKMVIILEEEAK